MARGKRGPRLGKTGCLFWLLILVVIVIIVLYRGKGSFRNTFRSLKGLGDRVTVVTEKKEDGPPKEPAPADAGSATVPTESAEDDPARSAPDEAARTPQQEKPPAAAPQKETAGVETGVRKPDTGATVREKSLNATVYFVKINQDDGSAKPVGVSRTVVYRDSPITRTVEALLDGVSGSEKNAGIISFIPGETKLISAAITNGHLTLNFSGGLENNYSGREATLLEISQILLTCFSFDGVQKITILIDGTRKEYITGEGVPLLQYYTRQDISRLVAGG